MKDKQDMFDILYQDNQVLVVQTHGGSFDKWGDDLYGAFNLGLHVADEPSRVLANRMTLLGQLHEYSHDGIHEISWLNQIHSGDVARPNVGMNCQDADALITHESGVALAIMTADCVPIALFSEQEGNSQIACVHAGWQGLTKSILRNVHQQFDHKNIKAVIGACISQSNYEIDKTLGHKIIKSVTDQHLVGLSANELYQEIIQDGNDKDGRDKNSNGQDGNDTEQTGKCQIDLVKLTKLQLAHLGIELINHDVLCSYDMPNLYSYRQQTHAHKPHTGRMATLIAKLPPRADASRVTIGHQHPSR